MGTPKVQSLVAEIRGLSEAERQQLAHEVLPFLLMLPAIVKPTRKVRNRRALVEQSAPPLAELPPEPSESSEPSEPPVTGAGQEARR